MGKAIAIVGRSGCTGMERDQIAGEAHDFRMGVAGVARLRNPVSADMAEHTHEDVTDSIRPRFTPHHSYRSNNPTRRHLKHPRPNAQ